MGVYTFANYKAYMKLSFGQMTELESVGGANMYGVWTNDAYLDLTTRNKMWDVRLDFEFPELKASDISQSTSDGVAYISVPTDCLIMYDVDDTSNNHRLDWRPWSWYIDKPDRANTSAEGKPDFWVRYGSYLYLYRTPASTYTMALWYRKRPALLTGATDVTLIGSEWDEIILELACYKGFRAMHDYDKAGACKEVAKEMILDRIGIYNQEKRAMRRQRIKPSQQFMNSYKRKPI